MSGNSIGKIFRVTTFGESHGVALGGIIDGVPPKIQLNEEDIQYDLNRRKPGNSKFTSPRKEDDKIKILSGVFEGMTTGTSIGILVENNDFVSKDYESIKNLYRPGHADYTYEKKYGIRDYRGGGRSSARETIIRVAAGSIAKKFLKNYDIKIRGYLSQMGNIHCEFKNWENVDKNPFFCSDLDKINDLENLINDLKDSGNSIGAKLRIIAENIPIGLGEPIFDRLDADIAHALMSINAVKGIEIGDGFSVVEKLGSENRDEIFSSGFSSNHSGGILGGISTGQNIVATIALKPTSSISLIGNTINKYGEETSISVKGRHDPCVGIRAIPIAEAMMSIIIMDHLLRYRAQCNKI